MHLRRRSGKREQGTMVETHTGVGIGGGGVEIGEVGGGEVRAVYTHTHTQQEINTHKRR